MYPIAKCKFSVIVYTIKYNQLQPEHDPILSVCVSMSLTRMTQNTEIAFKDSLNWVLHYIVHKFNKDKTVVPAAKRAIMVHS